jgi:hypothetical protein
VSRALGLCAQPGAGRGRAILNVLIVIVCPTVGAVSVRGVITCLEGVCVVVHCKRIILCVVPHPCDCGDDTACVCCASVPDRSPCS